MSTKIAMSRIKRELQKEPLHSSTLGPKVMAPTEDGELFLSYKDFLQGLGTLMTQGIVVFGPNKELIIQEEEMNEEDINDA